MRTIVIEIATRLFMIPVSKKKGVMKAAATPKVKILRKVLTC